MLKNLCWMAFGALLGAAGLFLFQWQSDTAPRIEGSHDREAAFAQFAQAVEESGQFVQGHFHCRWRWTPGDLAIWDERSTVHQVVNDHFPQCRTVHRCVVDGDRPFFDPEAIARA